MNLDVLTHENAPLYWLSADRYAWILDLTTNRPGLTALCEVMSKWVRHFFRSHRARGAPHCHRRCALALAHGLDVESTSFLNDLYEGREVGEERRERLGSLFKLTFDDAAAMREGVQGMPVYLGLAVTQSRELKFKPQNLLLEFAVGAGQLIARPAAAVFADRIGKRNRESAGKFHGQEKRRIARRLRCCEVKSKC